MGVNCCVNLSPKARWQEVAKVAAILYAILALKPLTQSDVDAMNQWASY